VLEDVSAPAAARSVAERALGLASREIGDLEAAAAHLGRAVTEAEQARERDLAMRARLSLAGVVAMAGELSRALQEVTRALRDARGVDRARVRGQRAALLQMFGDPDGALADYRAAIPVFRRAGDREGEAIVLSNRGVLRAYRGDVAGAERDLLAALALQEALGAELGAADARHNLGFVAARRGDVPAALRWFDEADRAFVALGVPRAMSLLDRCSTLLSVRVLAEARRLAEAAVVELEAAGMETDLAEAQLMLAQAALLDGDLVAAAGAGAAARRLFSRQRRGSWSALAASVELQTQWAAGRRSAALAKRARRLAEQLAAAGWRAQSLDAWVMAARVALARDDVAAARRDLAAATPARRRGPADLRARAWHAEALARLANGHRASARRALTAGLDVLADHDATLGATELRVHAATRGEELAALGVRLALADGKAAEVLRWVDQYRSRVLQRRPVLPSQDRVVAEALSALRRVAAELESATAEGADTSALLRQHAALEESVRRHTRGAVGESAEIRPAAWSIGELAQALGEAVLVALLEVDGGLHAVTVAGPRARLWPLGSAAEAIQEVDGLRFALARLARGRGSEVSLQAAGEAASHAAMRLDELLLAPLAGVVGDRPLVVVPTGRLHSLPWAALPSCRGRAINAVPSVALWLRAQRRRRTRPGRVVLVAGPDLPLAPIEVKELHALRPRATVLTDADASADAVARALDGATVAHIAAHGTFRADNPLFSALRLADGALTVYDLERLKRAPELFVLSACESGLTDVRPGDELMGLAGALFALGARTLVASLVPVPDATTRPLMVELHRRLLAGAGPAAALAGAQVAVSDELALPLEATAGFVSMGAG
jgi:hypothetical protein